MFNFSLSCNFSSMSLSPSQASSKLYFHPPSHQFFWMNKFTFLFFSSSVRYQAPALPFFYPVLFFIYKISHSLPQ